MHGPLVPEDVVIVESPESVEWEMQFMLRRHRYRVITPFADADGDCHPAGEEWTFVGSAFSRLDDELIFFVRNRRVSMENTVELELWCATQRD